MPVAQVWQLLQRFQEEPIGPKVQMRRWFTIWDAAWSMDRLWHTLLFALVMDYAMDGVDAWDLAGKIIPTIKDDDSKELKNFKLKQQVLIVLLDKLNQRMFRSYMLIFRRLRLHQSAYTQEGTSPETCLAFHIGWSHEESWVANMIIPTMSDALCSLSTMDRLMFTATVSGAPSPLMGTPDGEDGDFGVVFHHVRLVMDVVWQMIVFATQPTTHPWSSCLILHASEQVRKKALKDMRQLWELAQHIESSSLPQPKQLLQQVPVVEWATFREPLILLEQGRWSLDTPPGLCAVEYIQAMWSGSQHTLALENGFNDLRDNEGRGARHKARTEQTLQALTLSSMKARYSETAPLVQAEASDLAGQSQKHVRNEVFQGAKAPTSAADTGLEAQSLVDARSSWKSTTPLHFTNDQLGLLHALQRCPEGNWDKLWFAKLFKPHMVIRKASHDEVYYVIGARSHSVALMKLTHQAMDGRDAWRIEPTMGAFDFWTTITDMGEYKCHDYKYDLVFERKQVGVYVVLDDSAGVSLLAYCCKNFLHLLVMSDLKKLAAVLELKLPRMTSYMGFVEELLKQGGFDDADRDRMLELARARLAKRSRKATKKAAEPGVAEDEDEEDGGDENDEEGDDVVEGNPIRQIIA